MGILTGGGSKTIDLGVEYKYVKGKTTMYYVPGQHPGTYLLPPSVIMNMESLPDSVKGQIFDEETYDLYGKFAMAYEDGLIDSLVGKAKRDYEAWLKEDAQVASEIDKYVRNKLAEGGFKAVHVQKPEDQGDVDDHTDNWNDDDNI